MYILYDMWDDHYFYTLILQFYRISILNCFLKNKFTTFSIFIVTSKYLNAFLMSIF